MKHRIFLTVVCSAIIASTLFAQSGDAYLVSIRPDAYNRDKLETLQLPIYHIFDSTLIAGVSTKTFEALRKANIPFRIIDAAPWTEHYYIVTPKKGKLLPHTLDPATILVEDEWGALIKCASVDALRLEYSSYGYAELSRIPHFFKNERIVRSDHSRPESDSLIAGIISEIRADSVRSFIQSLQDFGTRYYRASTRDSVAGWIRNQFLSMGYTDVVIDSFQYQNQWQKNVIATLTGTTTPDRIIVIGGHHDSYNGRTDPMVTAPGADDNASGAVAALEMARAMKRKGYRPKSTLKFMTFAAEEAGLRGSASWAQRMKSAGLNIVLMINHDMISYTSKPVQNSNVSVSYYSGFETLCDAAMGLVNRFTPLTAQRGGSNSSGSDSYSFWSNGYAAIYFLSTEFSPFYHSPSDIITNYDMAYCAEVIKASCAMAIYYSGILQTPTNVTIADVGDGTSLLVRWDRSPEADVTGYTIRVGRSTGKYDTALTATDTSLIVRNLNEGIQYFIGVSSFSSNGNESFILERSGIPHVKPRAPANVVVSPQWHMISMHWSPNGELDLAGYNVYRATSQAGPQSRMNSRILNDTTFLDTGTENGRYYYYSVAAVDNLQNESTLSSGVRSRAVSLDQGILLADETRGGDGSPLNPSDAQIDSFYSRATYGFKTEVLDIEAQGGATLADLGAFSSVVWHGNDASSLAAALNSQQGLRSYLAFGGRVLISSYRPSAAFGGNTTTIKDFIPGDFVYDFLKISHSENRFLARFSGAIPLEAGYPPLFVDTTKTQVSQNYHLNQIEGIKAAPGASDIYSYETGYDTSRIEGKMKGQPVGIAYFGADFKIVVLSFPLYDMHFDAAKQFVRSILSEKFSEPTAVDNPTFSTPSAFALSQNYPNPFNPTTIIKFQIPSSNLGFGISDLGLVSLKVYDMLGREVATLVNDVMSPGTYTVQFNGSHLSGGVYFCRAFAGSLSDTKKMLLLK